MSPSAITRNNELAQLVRNAQQRIQLGKRATVAEEIRGQCLASIRALMEAHRVARWAAHGVYLSEELA